MMRRRILFLIISGIIFVGCGTSPSKSTKIPPKEDSKEVQSAVTSVVDSVRGAKRIVKYCPVCGKHYSASVVNCTVDDTPLKEIVE